MSYTYGDSAWGDLLTGCAGWTFSYDEIGNVTQAGAFTYTWEHGRQLANMTSSTADIDFTYDSDGMRVGKTVTSGSTVTDYDYIYNGGQLTGEVITTNGSAETLYYSYDASGKPVSVKYNNTLYFYITNLQGDVIAIMNGSGTIVVEYTYDAWGYIRNTTDSLKDTLGKANALRYRGYVYDTETCLYYLQSRYYNPGTGRFINADALVSTGQGMLGNNMFAYCNNNPVNYIDSNGQEPITISITAAALAVTAVIVVAGLVIVITVETLSTFIDWLSQQWYYSYARIDFANVEAEETLPRQGLVEGDPEAPPVDAGKQGKHVKGHNNYQEGKSAWPEGQNGVQQTQEAWQNGVPDPKKPDGSVRIGTASDGTKVRVHIDGRGALHGYPYVYCYFFDD